MKSLCFYQTTSVFSHNRQNILSLIFPKWCRPQRNTMVQIVWATGVFQRVGFGVFLQLIGSCLQNTHFVTIQQLLRHSEGLLVGCVIVVRESNCQHNCNTTARMKDCNKPINDQRKYRKATTRRTDSVQTQYVRLTKQMKS